MSRTTVRGRSSSTPLRLIAERRWIDARVSVDGRVPASPARDSRRGTGARGHEAVDDDAAKTKDYFKNKKETAKANGAGGDGSEGSDSDESAVVVEVSFASDALVSLEDKE